MTEPIVIVGGMGPQASIRLQKLLIRKSEPYHNGNNDEYPAIVHFSVPVPDFLGNTRHKKAAVVMLQSYSKAIKTLRPSQVLLACNTAHLVAHEVDYLRSAAFVSMIDIVAERLEKDGVKQIGLLASPTTIHSKLYERALGKRNIATLLPSPEGQKQIELIIRSVLAGKKDPSARTQLLNLTSLLNEAGAEAILLGCTELPLIFPKRDIGMPVYDCLDIYAQAVIETYYLYNGD